MRGFFLCLSLILAAGLGAEPTKVTGMLGGKPFRPNQFVLKTLGDSKATMEGRVVDTASQYILTISDGEVFDGASEISIWIAINKGQKIENLKILCRPYKFGTEEFRKQSYPPNKEGAVGRGVTAVHTCVGKNDGKMGRTDMFSDQISAQIAFGAPKSGRVAVRLKLTLPDAKKSTLSGNFVAKIQN